MKKIYILIAFLFTTAALWAQDCSQYVYMQKNKTIESTSFGENGNVLRKMSGFVADVATVGDVTTATLNATFFDKDGKVVDKRTIQYKCKNGTFMMDMSAGSSGKGSFKMDAGYMEYPPSMKVGDHFNDFTVTGQMTNGGKATTVTSKVTDRKVVAQEKVTTPAGSWTCFKITYNTTVNMPGLKMAPQTMSSTEWYAPNFGIVQAQVFGMTTKITGIH